MKTLFNFLKKLEANNQREWFQSNKEEYQAVEQEFKELVSKIEDGLQQNDELETASTKIFRIYRDVRFAKDKQPYHIHRSASFKRATNARRGGYYLRLQRGNSLIAGGFWGPEPADLLHIRKQIQQDPEPLRAIFGQPDYREYFNGLEGDQVKTAPKGFDKNDPAIDLLRHKGFIVVHAFTDKEVTSPDFNKKVVAGFEKMRPFFDCMTEILTTDLNGVSLLDR